MDVLWTLNQRQGFFARADALAVGLDDHDIARFIRRGLWRRLRNGAYVFAELWPGDPVEVHKAAGRAVAAKLGGDVVLSHVSAAHALGLRTWDVDTSRVHVTRDDAGAGRTEAHVVHHQGLLLPEDVVRVDGVQVTRPARAALETASLVGTESGLVTLDSVLHLGLCTADELAATYELMQSWPGMQRVGLGVRMADAGGQSTGESRSRYLFYTQSLPAPLTQFHVYDDDGRLVAVTDMAWPEHHLLGEFDGRVKYERLLRPGESASDAVFREKRREDRIRELLPGWSMIRLVWSDLYDPRGTAERIRRMLNLAA